MRNAEASREAILNAAMEEFSAFGIAGARVDRIAKTAGCNKNLIYIYFGNKETLFTTVLEKNLEYAFEVGTFNAEDLSGFASGVFDFAMAHPKVMRLLMWFTLEQNSLNLRDRDVLHDKKLQKILEAQNTGKISAALPANFLLTAMMSIATAYSAVNPFGPSLDPDALKDLEALKTSVAKAVTLLAAPNSPQR
ncbi:TetR family transcriptional regulator [Paenibacillus sp. NFR01]|uniref:TetR family transcriptional regulator n=1 Tax=Paenibacillus sp. NFR01 TaxID=1566279 RepID=UPI0008AE3D6E|nr:TetR family transcriptional regulator [Paenibacillus sp. NFR01]SET14421.1 transcriptional regulator, TetR family [Paenibacillus sp. NFR01]